MTTREQCFLCRRWVDPQPIKRDYPLPNGRGDVLTISFSKPGLTLDNGWYICPKCVLRIYLDVTNAMPYDECPLCDSEHEHTRNIVNIGDLLMDCRHQWHDRLGGKGIEW